MSSLDWSLRAMTRRSRRYRTNRMWSRIMWVCLILFFSAVYGLVSTLDLTDQVNAVTRCNEMVAIYQQSNGEFGWPNCNHL